MAWQTKSNRIVPSDWKRRKARILTRDQGICHACGHQGAEEVDHLLNVARGGSHDPDNLAAIHGKACTTCGRRCHVEKTSAEAAAGRVKRKRPVPRHPGLL